MHRRREKHDNSHPPLNGAGGGGGAQAVQPREEGSSRGGAGEGGGGGEGGRHPANVLERFDLSGSTSSREPRSTAANKIDRDGLEGRCRGVLIVSQLLLLPSDTLDSVEFDTVVVASSRDSGRGQVVIIRVVGQGEGKGDEKLLQLSFWHTGQLNFSNALTSGGKGKKYLPLMALPLSLVSLPCYPPGKLV